MLSPISDSLEAPVHIETNEPVKDISYLFAIDDEDNPGFDLPSTGGSGSEKGFTASAYQSFGVAEKTTMKLPVVTENVPCLVSPHFRVAVVMSLATSPLKELRLCFMDVPEEESVTLTCHWLVTCACPDQSASCLIRVSLNSGVLENAGNGIWRIQEMGPAWAE